MELTIAQNDALTELINIGYGRAATSLSDLTGQKVSLDAPRISMHKIDDICPRLARAVNGQVASVNQEFFGPISGNALLMMDEKAAERLSRLLSDDAPDPGCFDSSSREIITEVGNILLNACLGIFGNVLQVQVTFAVPRLQVSAPGALLKGFDISSHDVQYGLMVHTEFRLRESDVTGFLIILLGISSLDRMLREVSSWETRQA